MKIDREQVEKIAHLARLEITTAEKEQLTTQLSSILDYFDQLRELDTENVPPTTRAIELSNITRQDTTEVYSRREELLKEAPSQEGEFFKVPQILNTDEE